MVPVRTQLLVLTIPAVAIILSYLWFKRKRIGQRSDPGSKPTEASLVNEKSLSEELQEVEQQSSIDIPSAPESPKQTRIHTLSGVESSPIDIIIPRELRSQKASSVIISDEDLDLEIEKVRSMKSVVEPYHISRVIDTAESPHKSLPKPDNFIKQGATPIKVTRKQSNMSKSKLASNLNIKSSNNKAAKSAKKMVPKNIIKVEEKLEAMNLETVNKTSTITENVQQQEAQLPERDSANHSPADVMLASFSLSSLSDNHSEGSNDSGKGGSESTTPPCHTSNLLQEFKTYEFYEFLIPQTLVGKLIGRFGSFVSEIKGTTNATVIIKKHPSGNNKMKICSVQGYREDIENALQMIRDKFPRKRNPELTLEQVFQIQYIPYLTQPSYVSLVTQINNDAVISCLVAPNHFFLQLHNHPTFPNLEYLGRQMNANYADPNAPSLPKPIKEMSICVAESVGAWYRAMVMSTDNETEISHIVYLDVGGYALVENSKLKQIAIQYMGLPFQATECFLANIKPIGGTAWSQEAMDYMSDISARGTRLSVQIVGFAGEDSPLVYVFIERGLEIIFVNEELVQRGYAQYEDCYIVEEIQEEGAVGGVEVALATAV